MCQDRLKDAAFQKRTVEEARAKLQVEKDQLQRDAVQTSQRHFENVKGYQKQKDIAEHELKKLQGEFTRLQGKYRMLAKGYKELLQEVENAEKVASAAASAAAAEATRQREVKAAEQQQEEDPPKEPTEVATSPADVQEEKVKMAMEEMPQKEEARGSTEIEKGGAPALPTSDPCKKENDNGPPPSSPGRKSKEKKKKKKEKTREPDDDKKKKEKEKTREPDDKKKKKARTS